MLGENVERNIAPPRPRVSPVPVLVVAHGAVGTVVRRAVGGAAGLRVVGHVDRVSDVVAAVTALSPAVVVTDSDPEVSDPGWSGVLACGVGIVGVLTAPTHRRVLGWLRIGARGVVAAQSPTWVEPVVTATADGKVLVCPRSSAAVVDEAPWAVPAPTPLVTVVEGAAVVAGSAGVPAPGGVVLTRQQAAVLRVLAAGTTSADGAVALGMSGATFRTHAEAVLRRLGVHDRAAAVAWAYRSRFVTPPA